MADARAAACLAVLTDAADQISETNHRVGQWSVEEHRLYVSGVGRYGKRWSVIASHVGTRTGTQVRSHAVRTVAGREGHVPAPTLHPLGLGVLVGHPTCVAPPPAPSLVHPPPPPPRHACSCKIHVRTPVHTGMGAMAGVRAPTCTRVHTCIHFLTDNPVLSVASQ